MHESNAVLQTLTGQGHVSAEGCATVRVRYRVTVERRDGLIVAHGTLVGKPAGLHPIWLQPDAVLRLRSGRRLDISVTDLIGDTAEFESTGPVAD
ncbi:MULTISPECIES: hypothetical protein [Methylobacterium]|uniref:Copper-binding protein n=2 Tax=Pseudomonadota TaxID=1224 RepID=A0ABQ4T0N9_9HYPH|nr:MULTISPECIES: hypothetical protein [Methylobacterium]PIU07872.1 MAG: hypothetical protein COT56_03745 [Methylobacterium sp. CG09_land_8_20_14_0_10_71_15]PIU11071.1 MAG: hypothetical protein COT28_22040 [Methylobacterium sp. CG08_land_8_20_14_0_20_71_15]GJE07790.1 hypothetical protein AOPFMNJM_3120 [Methylobacterium jeotgali]